MNRPTDLQALSDSLVAMPEPPDAKSGRRYARAWLTAAKIFYAQSDFESTRAILLEVDATCRRFELLALRLKAARILARVLTVLREFDEARALLEEVIDIAEAQRKPQKLRQFKAQLAIVSALAEYYAEFSTDNGRVFMERDRPLPEATKFTVTQLAMAEAFGARRLRMRRTDFSGLRHFMAPIDVKPTGRRRAVATTTLLKKGFGDRP